MKITGKRYLDYSSFIKLKFGERVQKISLDTGFSCPNRDGSKGFGGCTYCNNNTFNPEYCEHQKSIKEQIEQGIKFFSRKGWFVMEQQLLDAVGSMLTYSYQEMVINIVLAMVLGFVVAWVYRYTHKGLSYSQAFTQTILFVSLVVAIVMMVIGSSLRSG